MLKCAPDGSFFSPALRAGIDKRTVRQMIAEKLKGLIVSGVLQSGDALPGERDLAVALGVSRETVRGAIQLLAAVGVVEVSQGSKTRIAEIEPGLLSSTIALPRPINAYEIEAVHRSRLLIEQDVVADVVAHVDARLISRLEQSLSAQSKVGDDTIQFLICDREFHMAIYEAGDNRLLSDFVADLYNYMMGHRRRAMSQPGAIARSYSDHIAIFTALEARDRDAALSAVRLHLERIYETTRSILGESVLGRSGREPKSARAVSPA
jgi:DNA-binding FadR family transcriptional regulator